MMEQKPWIEAAKVLLRETFAYSHEVKGDPKRMLESHPAYLKKVDSSLREETGWTYEEYRDTPIPEEHRTEFKRLISSYEQN